MRRKGGAKRIHCVSKSQLDETDPLQFTLLSENDKARLRYALDPAIKPQNLDPLWNRALEDLYEPVVPAQPTEDEK